MKPHQYTSIQSLLHTLDLPKPQHPQICVVEGVHLEESKHKLPERFYFDFYIITYKDDPPGKMKYGQQHYEFGKGSMIFVAPGQLLGAEADLQHAGYSLLVHPDFFSSFALSKKIKQFGFFSYSVNEALFLSEKEQHSIVNIFKNLKEELQSTADEFTRNIAITQIELLLGYCDRFYKRQFVSQQSASSDLLENLERLLNDYFDKDSALQKGLPSVKYLAEQLHYSPRYLSDMLRSLTGEPAHHHIQNKVIGKAKELLSITGLSVGEISWQLGFEQPQSFNKLFKKKTNLSPLAFRRSFS